MTEPEEPTTPEEAANTLAQFVAEMSDEFEEKCIERHAMGAEKHGPGKFLTVDTFQEALEEIIDLANYARYTYIKMRILQTQLADTFSAPQTTGFIPTSEFMEGPQQ